MLEGRHIVLVEDDDIMGASLQQRLALEGAEVQWHRQIARALPAIRTPRRAVDAVVCDIRLPDGTGEELYETLGRTMTPPPFLFITGQGRIDQAVRLIRTGAADYIAKPFDINLLLRRLVQVIRTAPALDLPAGTGISPAARSVDRQATEAALSDDPLWISGAPGLGKSRLARLVHDRSDRRAAPFVVLDVLRNGLTDAGLVRALGEAGDGTLMIVGVGRMTEDCQDRLNAALARPPGFRLIATSGLQLEARAAAGGFRRDLLARLQRHRLVVPPLSERPDDALWLAGQLFERFNAGRNRPLTAIAATAEAAILAHDWPGNGRELRARMARAVEVATGEMVLPADLFPEAAGGREIRPLADVRDAAERAQIAAALDFTGGQVAEAARLLRVSRTTLWEKMQKLGL